MSQFGNETPGRETNNSLSATGERDFVIDPVKQRRARIKLVSVIAVFAVPLLIATLWLHYVRSTGGSLGISVRGDLIHPAFPLESVALLENDTESFSVEELRGTWTMFYAPQGDCLDACQKNIYHMRQVRLALNHRMDRVQRVLLMQGKEQVDATLIREHPGLRVLTGDTEQYAAMMKKIASALSDSTGGLSAEDAIYLIDPFANLMMRFPADLPPKSMLKDIKHLLKVSRIG